MTESENKANKLATVEPYHLGEFAKGGNIDFITQGNVSIPLSLQLLRGIISVRQGDPEPSVTELVMFANAVIEQGCNCYLNECWLVMMRGKYVPIIAAQKRIAKAQSMPSYDGYEWGWIGKEGVRCPAGPENKVKQADIIGVWGRIYFKNRKVPFYHEVFCSEYKYPKSDRKITMLLKTARDQLHRYAFANEMGNLCTENEPYEEPLPAPETDVQPREKRRMAVPSTEVDTTRAPVAESELAGESAASETTIEAPNEAPETPAVNKETGEVKDIYVEVTGMYADQNGTDFLEFACYVLCLDEDEVSPSKLSIEQLNQIKAYIGTNGVAIS